MRRGFLLWVWHFYSVCTITLSATVEEQALKPVLRCKTNNLYADNLLQTVFLNGAMVKEYSLEEIRGRASATDVSKNQVTSTLSTAYFLTTLK